MRPIFMLVLLLLSLPTWGAVSGHKFDAAMAEFVKAPEQESVRDSIRSIELDFASRDLLLEPTFELDAKRLNEHRLLINPVTKTRDDELQAFLIKPFSTGTTLKLIPTVERSYYLTQDRWNTDWQISISQDLWQDFFGRSTRLRWSREGFERRQQVAAALQQLAQLQVDFESLYWDWAEAVRERDLRMKNVTRGQEILKWMRDRFRRSAAENSDVLQAEALLATRELELVTVEQNLPILAARMQRYLPGVAWTPDPDELAGTRDVDQLRTPWKLDELARAEKLELVSARNAAQAAEKRADESREQIRPVLNVQAYYGKNGLDPNSSTAVREAMSDTHEYSGVGLVFSTGLDVGLEHKKVESARAARDSAKQHLVALEADAKVAWDQLKNSVQDLYVRIGQARKLADLQWKKANEERRRYRLGRSTAFQVITFEQDAGEAEIALWNLLALTRKTEAQARLYAR
jgi:outer membrane protein TolC